MIRSAVCATFVFVVALVVSACTVNGTPVTPKTPTWTTFGELSQPRAYATAVGLASGEILVVGGLDRADSNVTNADSELVDVKTGAVSVLHQPAVVAALRCGPVYVPNHKLIPDARWILDSVGQRNIVARSQARADVGKGAHELENRIRRGSVAVYPLGSAVFFEAIVDVGDDPRDQVPLAGFQRIYTSRYYAVYANC